MSSSSANQQRGGGETPVQTPPGSPSTVWATPAAHRSSLSDNEHSPTSPTIARPSQTSPLFKQRRRFASLSAINTKLTLPRPRPPRRSLPALGSVAAPFLDEPPEPSPLTAILEGIASAGLNSDNHPSLLADGDVGVLDSANLPTPITAFESNASTFFMDNRTAVERLCNDLQSQPAGERNERVIEVLTTQIDYIDECFKYVLQATKRARESEEAQSLKTRAEESDRARELRKLKKENKALIAEKAELDLELCDVRDTNRQLQADFKAREAALAASPAYDGPMDEKLMKLWFENEARDYVTDQQQAAAFSDDRTSTYDSISNGDDESIPVTPTATKRRRAKRSFFGTDINPEMLEMMEEFVTNRLTESTITPAQSDEEMRQQIKKLQSDLDDEKFQHRLVVEDWERIKNEPISLEFYAKAAARESLPFPTKTTKQLRDKLAVIEERPAEETKRAEGPSADVQDRAQQLEKDLVAQNELIERVQTELDTWKREFKTVEAARGQIHDLEERNKEQAGYIQLRSEAWRHADANEQAWKNRLDELQKDFDDLQTKNDQFLERIGELEDHEKSLESQLEEQTKRANQLDAYKTENESKTDQFIERIEELEDQHTSLEARLQEHQSRIDNLQAEKAEAEAHIALITAQVEQLETELEDQTGLNVELAEAKRQLADMESDLRAKRLELSESEQRIQNLEQTKAELEDQLSQFQELQEEERCLRRELADKDDNLLTEQLRNVDLSSEIRKLTDELKAVQEDVEIQQSKCDDFIQRIEELEDEVREQQTHIDELEATHSLEAQHLATIKGLEATIVGLQAQIEHHLNTISLLTSKPPLSAKRVELLRRQTQTPRDLRKMLLRLTTQKKKYHDRWLRTKQALGMAREDLARLLVQRDVDTERERQLREQIASLERDFAETSASLMRAMAELGMISKIDGPSAEDTHDAVDDLPPSPPITPHHTSTTYCPNCASRKSTDVAHLHGEACFCTLVDYFLPGVLGKMLPESPASDCTCCDDQETYSHTDDGNDSGYETQYGVLSTKPTQVVPGSEKENSPQSPTSPNSLISDRPPSTEPIQIDPGLDDDGESDFDVPLRKMVTDPGPGFGYNHAYNYGLQVLGDEGLFEPYGVHSDEETHGRIVLEMESEQEYSTRSECGEDVDVVGSIQDGASQAEQGCGEGEEEGQGGQPAFEEAEDQSVGGDDFELSNTQMGLSLRGGGSSDAGSSERDKETADLFDQAQERTTEQGDEHILPAVIISTPGEAQTTDQDFYLPVTPSRTQGRLSSFPTPMTGTTVFGTGDPDGVKPTLEDPHALGKQGLVAASQLEDPFQVAEDSQTRGHIDDTHAGDNPGDSDGRPGSRATLPQMSHQSNTKPKIHFPPLSTDTTIKKRTTYPKSPAVPKRSRKNCACNCHVPLSRKHYHGHTTTLYASTADLFTRETAVALVCHFLTALSWLGLLIFHTPGTFLSTTSILFGYFFLPLRYIFAMGVYSIRQFTYRVMPPFPTLRTTYAPPVISRPSMPVMPRPSAHQLVTSAIFLLVAYNVLVSEALTGERSTWTTPNRFRTAYAADLIDHRPYPGWSPISVDFRFVVRDWCNALIFFRGWMGDFIRGINSVPAVAVLVFNLLGQTIIHGLAFITNTVISAGDQLVHFYRGNIDVLGEWLERSLDWILHALWFPFPIIGFWLTASLDWIIQTILLPFAILNFLVQTLLIHVHQLAAKYLRPECRGGLTYLGECALEYARDRFDALGEWLETPLVAVEQWMER
ncbi:hypothetical protein DL546_002111 [Coniochaeta pulveracea]|uniref:Uncharacterized protein n=1 Tax=Coniochaeta pulveracea TaxID=177199 RepID=A0A420XYQ2_9PEZI|nr:hypothetical protein DL546_002111 [Coniochaeta pulveracea]